MQKLLIADSSKIFTSALAAALGDRFEICVCGDGPSTLAALQREAPDILIINLMLPYSDGITVLRESLHRPQIIMAITMFLSSYVEQSMATLGIDYTFISPSVETVVLRLLDLQQQYSAPPDTTDLSDLIMHHLRLLNFPTHLTGYRQLCIALPRFAQDPQQFLTKELYPAVAKIYGRKDGRAVEHSIRKAIQAAWRQRDNAVWCKYFTPGPQGHMTCPSNKEFLCRLAQILRAEASIA